MNDLAKDLQKPFAPEDIEWRPQSWGKKENGEYWAQVLAYVTNRAIMNRLDDVVGPMNWKNQFTDWHNGSQLCGISICVDSGWVTKWDGAECTHIEAIKGGLSDAMKRAAVQWGIGRYLYKLDTTFARQTSIPKQSKDKGWYRLSAQDDKGKWGKPADWHTFFWLPPNLPQWALPEGHTAVKDTAFHAPEIPSAPAVETNSPAGMLKALMIVCSTMDELQGAWGGSTLEVRNQVGAEFLAQQKERLNA